MSLFYLGRSLLFSIVSIKSVSGALLSDSRQVEILLTVSSITNKFLMNYLQKLYKALKLMFQLIIFMKKIIPIIKLLSPSTFYKRFKFTWVIFFITDFNLLIFELDKFAFKVLFWDVFY